jgi:acyl-CoA reductase-like NAD-dependent aldehyde dehydrogenase
MPSLDVDKLQAPMRATHASRVNLTYEWRKQQLQSLHKMLTENTDKIREAMSLDLGRDPTEAICCETKPLEREILYALKHLKEWMKPEWVPSPAVMIPAWSKVEPKPLDSPGVLIIGPFNYPVQCTLRPLVGVLAGGNPAVIKPSEMCPNVCAVLKALVEQYFDAGCLQVVLGAIPETTALLEKPWAKVVFTGSGRVGAIIAQACGKTLTPTILELGGKTPVVVDESVPTSHLQNVADRIIFAKCMNAGQTCIAPDTLFVHEKHAKELCKCLKRAIEEQFGTNQKLGELSRIISVGHTNRLIDILKEAETAPGAKLVHGGSQLCDVDTRYICPTLILNPPANTKLHQEEIFGPILPIIVFQSRSECIDMVQSLEGTPLSFYIFVTSEAVFQEYTEKCRSAGAIRNDCIIQGSSLYMPLGGLGASGYGRYNGKYSFDSFTHAFPTLYRPLGSVWDSNNLRCHPYAGWKGQAMEMFVLDLPDIAVLHTRKLLVSTVILGCLWASPGSVQFLKLGLATILEALVETLRR